MRKVLSIARREYKAAVKTKGFFIGLVLAPVFMGGGAIVMALTKDRVDTRDKQVAIVDHTGRLADHLIAAAESRNSQEVTDPESGEKVKPAYVMLKVVPDADDPERQLLGLSDKVRSRELHSFVEIGAGVIHPRADGGQTGIRYYGDNSALDDIRNWIEWPLNDKIREIRLSDAGLSREAVPDLFDWIHAQGLGLVSADTDTGQIQEAKRSSELESILLPLVLVMLMFLMVMMGAASHLQSVMQEKVQRIAEVMLGSVSPFELMLGKLIGGVGVSLTAISFYILVGAIMIRHLGVGHLVPYHLLPWFFTYMILAIFMFGSIHAALGSLCNDPSEAQSLTMPAMLPILVPMFTWFTVVREPLSGYSTCMSLIPPFTPFLMLMRQAIPGGVYPWQPWVGLVGVILTTLFFVWVGGRVFRVGILIQGAPPSLRNLMRWATRG